MRAVAIDEPRDAPWRRCHYDWIISLDDDREECETATLLDGDRLSGAHLDADGQQVYSSDLVGWFGMGVLRPGALRGLAAANELKRANARSYGELLYEGLGLRRPVARPSATIPAISRAAAAEWLEGARHLRSRSRSLASTRPRATDGSSRRGGSMRRRTWRGASPTTAGRCSCSADVPRHSASAICERAAHTDVVAGPPDFDLLAFAALVGVCTALVCSDSLAMDLAIAGRVPVVALFGPRPTQRSICSAAAKKSWRPCRARGGYRSTCDVVPNCMQAITPDMVFARVRSGRLARVSKSVVRTPLLSGTSWADVKPLDGRHPSPRATPARPSLQYWPSRDTPVQYGTRSIRLFVFASAAFNLIRLPELAPGGRVTGAAAAAARVMAARHTRATRLVRARPTRYRCIHSVFRGLLEGSHLPLAGAPLECALGRRRQRHGFESGTYAFRAAYPRDLRVQRQRLRDDLIHVVVPIGRQPPDEVDARRPLGEFLILLVERRVLGARDRIVRVALRPSGTRRRAPSSDAPGRSDA